MRSMPATRLAAYQIVWFEIVLAVRKPYQVIGPYARQGQRNSNRDEP